MHIFYNGDIIDEADLDLGVNNRAFQYGDGLFETIICQSDQLSFEQYHKERLIAGMKALDLSFSNHLSIHDIFEGIHSLIKKVNYSSARVRLQVWRKTGGLYTPSDNEVEVIATCSAYPFTESTPKLNASFSKDVQLTPTPWSSYKTISALPYVQAALERERRGLDELILLDQLGNIAECSSSNVFWKKGNVYFTPSLKTGCIEGIMRRHVIKKLRSNNLTIQIGEYSQTTLHDAEEVFTTNVTGIHSILSIDECQYAHKLSIKPLLEL
jgi:branched-chain amino acid aminotransferase/4-amino-4-deoxychorismate lyase